METTQDYMMVSLKLLGALGLLGSEQRCRLCCHQLHPHPRLRDAGSHHPAYGIRSRRHLVCHHRSRGARPLPHGLLSAHAPSEV